MSNARRVLVVDDDAAVREALGQTLELADIEAILAGSYIEAKDHIGPEFDGVVVSDIRMPGRDGFYLLAEARRRDDELPVILLTGEGDVPMAVKGIGEGAFDFLEKPCGPRELVGVVEKALKARALVLENRRLKRELERGDAASRMIFGHSAEAQGLRAQVRAVARAGAEVLVTGGPGSQTAKVAEVIHLLSPAAPQPFVKRLAASLDEARLDMAVEAAGAGTLFLDEISALPASVQLVLLDRLEAPGEARIIAGTTRDLVAEMEAGRFAADLYYRLDVMQVRIPTVEERREDIPVLFRHYVAQAAEQAGIPEPEVTEEHLAGLMAQDWPGNARSLMSAAMRFVLGMPGEVQEAAELGLAEQMARVEKSLIAAALGRQNGNATATAAALGLPRKTFYDKLAKHGLKAEDFRR
ncbi:sigma-54-dependent transcriptional regulator [Vannielia litorea]|uniref:sigma-54-dependent transcriptional regulator n=1 Tax=Vannielia litorea TaxID=1217970 RepID=UPI001BCE238E|nr:sigma-54 dependent transcriptional regulator [Vannielia litorea]MBS8227426.1 sigma-54-dependent Fis family transcriptional regulator [Vannielia litorea]